MQTLKFSIIIITWNGIRLLKEFLPSVIASEYANFEIIVADNHSDDETVAWVREYAPEVKVVELDRKLMITFPTGMRSGTRVISGRSILRALWRRLHLSRGFTGILTGRISGMNSR